MGQPPLRMTGCIILMIAGFTAMPAAEAAWGTALLQARECSRRGRTADEREEAFATVKARAPDCSASFAGLVGGSLGHWASATDDAGIHAAVHRLIANHPRPDAWRQRAGELEKSPAGGEAWLALFQEVWKDALTARRPEVPRLACIRRSDYGMHGTNATMFAHRTSRGSAVVLFDPAQTRAEPQVIFETKDGFIWDLNPSWDGRRLLMSYKESADLPFHVWELDIASGRARQVTSGPYHDFNPVEYPDGRIVFCSSRVESYSLCQDFLASALHIVSPDGANLRRIDFTTLCTMKPAILPDGTILTTRWEYNDKNIFSWQGLWTIHPDGRQLKLYYGNTLTIPNSRYGGRPVPGTDQILITMAGHHLPPIADIALVDRRHGLEALEGMRKLTFETTYQPTKGRTWRDLNWGPGDRFFPWSVCDPWPLRDGLFLAAFGREPAALLPGRFSICAATYDGVRWPVIDLPSASFFSPVALAARAMPPAIPTEAPQEPGEGTFFVQDVYQGLLEQGVQRGQVKTLRILRHTPKKWNTEGPRFHDHYPVVGYGSYYVKENLGEVPVDEDGSVYFRAPSNRELSFIALDEKGKEVQRMGSVLQITTGERVSCVGCHEDRQKAPPASMGKAPRLSRAPDVIRPPPWGAGPFDYVHHVQPVWDRYCVSCHAGRTPAASIDCSGDKTRFFSMSYDQLVPFTEHYYINPGPTGVFPALKSGSQVSRLSTLIEEKHQGANLDDDSRRRVYAWIDSNIQYYPTWDMSRPHTTGGRDPWFFCPDDKHVLPQPEPWFRKLCGFYTAHCGQCHDSDFAGYARSLAGEAPEQDRERRGLKDVRLRHESVWGGGHPIDRWINLTRPEFSHLLNAHLARKAGGLELTKKDKPTLLFTDTNDATYRGLLDILRQGAAALAAKPRMDMPGGKAVPQERNFGRVF